MKTSYNTFVVRSQRLVALTMALALLAGGSRIGLAGAAGATPADAKVGGRSLSEWMTAYFVWSFSGAPADQAQQGRVRFVPLPAADGSGTPAHLDLDVKPGTTLFLPLAAFIGEEYLNGTSDLPAEPEWLTAELTIDGRRVDTTNAYVAPTDFDPPFVYDQPSDYGSRGALVGQ